MPTLIREPDIEGHETLQAMCTGTYLDGECYLFAVAVAWATDWPIVGLMEGEIIRHAVLRAPDGRFFDARGFITEEELGASFGHRPPYDLRDLEPEALLDLRPMNAIIVKSAERMAQAVWPELPWKSSFRNRIAAYAKALELVSEAHGFWIRAVVPAAAPVIAPSEGDEGGYAITPTADGLTFTIERYFKRQSE